tara:strand:- start:3026 stop:3871 length:846 start_codon:yes stop_codon:yes gene_type:complete
MLIFNTHYLARDSNRKIILHVENINKKHLKTIPMTLTIKKIGAIILTCFALSCTEAPNKEKLQKVTKDNQMLYVWSLNAILNKENHVTDFVFGGVEKSTLYSAMHKESLKEWWDIDSKKSLLESVSLLTEGQMHHAGFMEDYNGFFDLSEEEYQQNLKDYPKYNTLDTLIWENKTQFKEHGIIAWDIIRASGLIGMGYQSGYITYDESYALCLKVGEALQHHFTNYEDMADNYVTGYFFWSFDEKDYNARRRAANSLLKNEDSAWNIFPFDFDMTRLEAEH